MTDEQQTSFETIVEQLKKEFPDGIIGTEELRGDFTINVKKDAAYRVLQYLKETPETAFDFLIDVTAVDHLKIGGPERYAVVYHLLSMSYHRRLRIKAWVPEDDLTVDSAISLWKTANWQEREVHDMFGIKFDGHPDLRPLLLPDDFIGYPLRKDFPLKGVGYREQFPNIKDE